MDPTGEGWVPKSHLLVRDPADEAHDIPEWMGIGERVIGLVATATWAIDGVFVVVAGDRRRAGARLTPIEPIVDHCGVAVTAVEGRMRRSLPRAPGILDVGWADLAISAIRAETISPTPWYRLDLRCARYELGVDDASAARIWGCNTCGRDPRTEYTPRFEAHRTGLRIDPRIDLDITIAVCPSCHEILHQPLAPTATELMYGMRPSCPRCSARHADIVAVDHSDVPLPIGVSASTTPDSPLPDFQCGACGHEW